MDDVCYLFHSTSQTRGDNHRGKNRSEDESPNYFTQQKAVVYQLVSSCSDLSFITEKHVVFVNALEGEGKG